jgi:DNA-binding NarL/FixJ family response regulator
LYEHHITARHTHFYIDENVQGIVYKNQDVDVLIKGIRTSIAGKKFHCPITEKFFGNNLGKIKKLLSMFSDKELKVVRLFSKEKTTKQIAEDLFTSIDGIESISKKLKAKTNSNKMIGVIMFAIRHGLIDIDP